MEHEHECHCYLISHLLIPVEYPVGTAAFILKYCVYSGDLYELMATTKLQCSFAVSLSALSFLYRVAAVWFELCHPLSNARGEPSFWGNQNNPLSLGHSMLFGWLRNPGRNQPTQGPRGLDQKRACHKKKPVGMELRPFFLMPVRRDAFFHPACEQVEGTQEC